MFERLKLWLVAVILVSLFVYLLPVNHIANYIKYVMYKKTDLLVSLTQVNPQVKGLCADPANKLILRVRVRNKSGEAAGNANVVFSVKDNIGKIYPDSARTDKYGEYLVTYIPPAYNAEQFQKGPIIVTITAGLYKLDISSSISIGLSPVPIVFVHGYHEDSKIFDNLKEYLSARGFESGTCNYDTVKGVISSASELGNFLQQQKQAYISKGLQTSNFDIIAHSMGGLVTRYYSCSEDYINKEDVRKIIFVSVPQHGSHWAAIGKNYFNDQGINDLIPESELFTKIFPSMLNKGLNNRIQSGSILGEFDEVVVPPSASLDEWDIKTEVYTVGENTLTMDNILNGNILEATNHKAILNNKKVFERIETMLNTSLPFPSLKKQ